jgi:hypothetical protein
MGADYFTENSTLLWESWRAITGEPNEKDSL